MHQVPGPIGPPPSQGVGGTPGRVFLTEIEGFNRQSLLRSSSGLIPMVRTLVLNIWMLSTKLDLLKSPKLKF